MHSTVLRYIHGQTLTRNLEKRICDRIKTMSYCYFISIYLILKLKQTNLYGNHKCFLLCVLVYYNRCVCNVFRIYDYANLIAKLESTKTTHIDSIFRMIHDRFYFRLVSYCIIFI